MSRKQLNRKFAIESLEARDLKAGNVTVSATGGDLFAVGDNAGNQIEIHQTTGNLYQVTGLNGTTINGRHDKTFRVTGDWNIDLKGGNDEFRSGGVVFFDDVDGNLNIKMGTGTDKVVLGKVDVTGSTTIQTEADADEVIVSGFGVFNSVNIDTAAGNDRVNVAVATVGNLTVDTAAGDDNLQMFAVIANGAVNLKGGTENDLVKVETVRAATSLKIDSSTGADEVILFTQLDTPLVEVKTGSDNDVVTARALFKNGQLSIGTADGFDFVDIFDSTIDKALDINTGRGDDIVSVSDSVVKQNITIDTAAGNDGVELDGVTATGKDITINTGDNADLVRLNAVIADDLFADLGNDDDEIRISNSTFDIADIDGNFGADNFLDQGGNSFNQLLLASV